jgi:hypothetical protein
MAESLVPISKKAHSLVLKPNSAKSMGTGWKKAFEQRTHNNEVQLLSAARKNTEAAAPTDYPQEKVIHAGYFLSFKKELAMI